MDETEFALGRGAVNDPYVHQVLAGGMRQAQWLFVQDGSPLSFIVVASCWYLASMT
jgi:hypothetical protein